MSRFLKCLLVLSLSMSVADMKAQQPPFEWAISLDPLDGHIVGFPTKQALDNAGNVYITGFFQGTYDFDPGPNVFMLSSTLTLNVFVLKLDSMGNFLWAKSIGGDAQVSEVSYYRTGVPVAVDPEGNVCLTSFFRGTYDFDPGPDTYLLTSHSPLSDIFIMELDGDGNFRWAKHIGPENAASNSNLPKDIAVDDSGSVFVTGVFTAMVDFDPGPGIDTASVIIGHNAFLLKLDSEGQFSWVRIIGGIGQSSGLSVVVTDLDEIVVSGYYKGTIDADPGPGEYNLTHNIAGSYNFGAFLLKLDAAGQFLWAKSWGNNRQTFAYTVEVSSTGDIYMAGEFGGTMDFDPGEDEFKLSGTWEDNVFVLKLSADGDFDWAGSLTQTSRLNDGSGTLAIDKMGNLNLTGYFIGPVDFDPGPETFQLTSNGYKEGSLSNYSDVFLLNLSSDGSFRWVSSIGGPREDKSTCVILDDADNLYLSGVHNGLVDVDPGEDSFFIPVDQMPLPGNAVFATKWKQPTVVITDPDVEGNVLYPNPFHDAFFVKMENASELTADVYSRDGKRILSQPFNSAMPIQLEAPAGVYFVHIKDTNGLRSAFKVVKQPFIDGH